jgi:linoleoyl-CoA desaturase
MKKIRFIPNDKQQSHFVTALRRNVNEYFKENGISPKANSSVMLQGAIMLILFITPYLLVISVDMPFWIAALMPLVAGFGLAGIGMCIMHGAVHEAFSNRKWVNKVFGASMYLLGNNVSTWKLQHNLLHHTYTNISGFDRDIDTKVMIRLSEREPLLKAYRYQHIHAFFLYGLMTLSMLVKDFVQLIDYRRQGLLEKHKFNFGRELATMILIKITHLCIFLVLPLLLTDYTWGQVLLGWLVMHWMGGFILSVIFQLAHVVDGVEQPFPSDEGVISCDWAVHELMTTANFARKNYLLNWYLGGLNFQIEHHLFPNICHIHYPKIAPIVERTAKEYGYPYVVNETLWDALKSHVRKLRQLGSVAPVMG